MPLRPFLSKFVRFHTKKAKETILGKGRSLAACSSQQSIKNESDEQRESDGQTRRSAGEAEAEVSPVQAGSFAAPEIQTNTLSHIADARAIIRAAGQHDESHKFSMGRAASMARGLLRLDVAEVHTFHNAVVDVKHILYFD